MDRKPPSCNQLSALPRTACIAGEVLGLGGPHHPALFALDSPFAWSNDHHARLLQNDPWYDAGFTSFVFHTATAGVPVNERRRRLQRVATRGGAEILNHL